MNARPRCMLLVTLATLMAILSGASPPVRAAGTTNDALAVNGTSAQEGLAQGAYKVSLPVAWREYCGNFFDDFSRPTSGWYTGEDEYELVDILNGEYHVLTKSDEYVFLFTAPTCVMDDYVLEVDARWEGKTGDSYNLIFEVSEDYAYYYLFSVNSDYQGFALYYRNPSGWMEIIPPTGALAIHPGLASNHLKVQYGSSAIILEANGVILAALGNFPQEDPGQVGVAVIAYEGEPEADARFDNFRLARVSGATTDLISLDGASANKSTPGEVSAWVPQFLQHNGIEAMHH